MSQQVLLSHGTTHPVPQAALKIAPQASAPGLGSAPSTLQCAGVPGGWVPGEKQQDPQIKVVQSTDAGKNGQGLAMCLHKKDAGSVFLWGAELQSLARARWELTLWVLV